MNPLQTFAAIFANCNFFGGNGLPVRSSAGLSSLSFKRPSCRAYEHDPYGLNRTGLGRWGRLLATCVCMLTLGLGQVQAADTYVIDTKGAHAFIQFKISHLGFSWLLGQFNEFSGSFELDEQKPENSSVMVDINVASLDSNHAERDKHLRGKDFFDVKAFPKAQFKSTKIEMKGDKKAIIHGDLTLKGVTKNIALTASYVGGGKDPWGGYRQGFEATTTLRLKDFGIDYKLGPASETAQVMLHVEGIRQ